MLTRTQFERLIDSRNENQIISALADTPYGETRAEDVDTMLTRAAVEEDRFFKRYLEEEGVHEFFRAPDLVSNLKFALRRYYGAELAEELFLAEGSPPAEEFARLLEGEGTDLPNWISEAAGEVVAANYAELVPASIDLILDRALIERQHQLSRGYSFLSVLLSLRVDFANLLSLLRLKVAGEKWEEEWEEFVRVFLPHGVVPLDRFKGWWDVSPEGWAAQIPEVQQYSRLGDGLREAVNSFLFLERQMKEEEITFFLSARRLTFGYEPLVGYALTKREERHNIRRIVAGLRYRLEADTIRKSIAWF